MEIKLTNTIYVVGMVDINNDQPMMVRHFIYPTEKRAINMVKEMKGALIEEIKCLRDLKDLSDEFNVDMDNDKLYRLLSSDGTREIEIFMEGCEVSENLPDEYYLTLEVKGSVDEDVFVDLSLYENKEDAVTDKNRRAAARKKAICELYECEEMDIVNIAGTYVDEEDNWTFISEDGWDEISIMVDPLNVWWKNMEGEI